MPSTLNAWNFCQSAYRTLTLYSLLKSQRSARKNIISTSLCIALINKYSLLQSRLCGDSTLTQIICEINGERVDKHLEIKAMRNQLKFNKSSQAPTDTIYVRMSVQPYSGSWVTFRLIKLPSLLFGSLSCHIATFPYFPGLLSPDHCRATQMYPALL